MNKAAGIMFVASSTGNALFLKRGITAPDFPGSWDFPGGGREEGEDAEACAIRETREEVGFLPDGLRTFHTRTKGSAPKGVAGIGASPILPVSEGAPAVPAPDAVRLPDVDFTTFLQTVDEEFTPVLNDEHDGFAWAPLNAPPQPIHPGCQIALDRITLNELGVARAIADGRLISPQRYENMYLFAIRITGTDVAFRSKAEEFVVRPPEIYLNSEFLQRCNGLPVIFKHPKKSLLNSEEFSDRVVGTVFLPYIAGDEVWAVVKIYVDDVARMMADGDLSTSPGVNFADWSVNRKMTLHLRDGTKEKVLVEGDPSLLDHVALCELGVWDKGEAPSGVRSESREDSQMNEAEIKAKKDAEEAEQKAKDDAARKDSEEKAKKDAEEKAKADAEEKERQDKAKSDADGEFKKMVADSIKSVADAVAGMGKRLDAFEMDRGGRKDSEEEKEKERKDAEEKAKKDAEEKAKQDAEEKAKADAAAASTAEGLRKRIDEVALMIPKDMNDVDYHSLVDCQARADSVFADFGLAAPRPQQGETPGIYERRCVRMLKEHSPTWKGAAVDNAFADDASFQIVRDQVYREAKATANNPVNVPAGKLLERSRQEGGHTIKTFVGQPRDWMDPLAGATQLRGTGVFLHQNLGR